VGKKSVKAVVNCSECGKQIPHARLLVLPNTMYCIDCSDTYSTDFRDPDVLTSKGSGSGRNGFAPKD